MPDETSDEELPKEMEIGGVVFEPIDPAEVTADQYLYTLDQIGHVALAPIEEYAKIADDETRGFAIFGDAGNSGRAFTLLASVLKRKGEDWSRELAPTNAELFRKAKGAALGFVIRHLGREIPGLFKSGSGSRPTSAISSPPTETAPVVDTSAAPATTSDRGTPRSAPSPATIPVGLQPLLDSPFAKYFSRSENSPEPELSEAIT